MKGRKNRACGGGMDSPSMGTREYEQDMREVPTSRVNAPKITKAAEERKRGGKAMGKVAGMAAKAHMGRKPRKAGGRVGADSSPLSSAHSGTPAKGRHTVNID
jgi:hypothetical protein